MGELEERPEGEGRNTAEVPWPAVDGIGYPGFDTGRMRKEDIDGLNEYIASISAADEVDTCLKSVENGRLSEAQMFKLQDDIVAEIRGKDLNSLQDLAGALKNCVPEDVRSPEIREDFEYRGLVWASYRIPDTKISVDAMVDGRRCIITVTDIGVSMYVECSYEQDLYVLYCD